MSECVNHLDYAGDVCKGCNLKVDDYGNTEDDFKYCSYPDCGCDGSRLCMAKDGPSDSSIRVNVEGMWSNNTPEKHKAISELLFMVNKP